MQIILSINIKLPYDEYEPYHIKTPLSSPEFTLRNFIRVFDVELPSQLLEDLLSNAPVFCSAAINEGTIDTSVRNCFSYKIENGTQNFYDVKSAFGKVLDLYMDQFSDCYCTEFSEFVLLKYEEGGFYKQHTDSATHVHRQIAISILMNDDFEGGQIAFFDRRYIPLVKKYQALVFPANFLIPHEVLNVTKGVRYSLISWAS